MILRDEASKELFIRVGAAIENPLIASYAYDAWALGCVLFHMCTGQTLFQTDKQDDLVGEHDLMELYQWRLSIKETKLSKIKDPIAKNLVSQLLSKNPNLRPDVAHVLSHPFMTGSAG